jgi:O-antigen ligase
VTRSLVLSGASGAGRLHEASARAGAALPTLLTAALTGLVAADRGGYWPTSWGWTTLALCSVALVALALGGERPSRLELAWAAGLVAVCAWTALSMIWTTSRTQTGLEVERTLVYVSLALATLAVVRRAAVAAVLRGAWAGATLVCLYALATRLLPDRIGSADAVAGYRLATPVGYWNALGLTAAVAALLAAGLLADDRPLLPRALAGASVPPLFATLYFTFSRGAWVALAAGLLLVVALAPTRLRFTTAAAALAVPAAGAVALAYHAKPLRVSDATRRQAVDAGHTLTWQLALLAVGAALVACAWALAARRLRAPAAVRRGYAAVLVAAAIAAIAGALVHYGGPGEALSRARHALDAPPVSGGDLSSRLLTLSNNGRFAQWHVAVDEWRSHPVVGSGAGTYEQYWAKENAQWKVLDVHNLYLETLGELGLVGLVLLAGALLVPLAGAVRARAVPLAVIGAGVYGAWLVDSAYEWNWEIPAVTVLALACAGAALAAGRDERAVARGPLTWSLVGVVAVAGVAGTLGLVGNRALDHSADAAARGAYADALADARRARTLAPWSSSSWAQIAAVRIRQGRTADAAAAYRRAVEKDPHDWSLWLSLASVTRGQEHARAVAEVRKLYPLVGAQIR